MLIPFRLGVTDIFLLEGVMKRVKLRQYYVYLIFRLDWTPCYVGKGVGTRWKSHFLDCKNKHLSAIIEKSGGILPVLKLQENLSNKQAGKLEVEFIKIIGREINGGPLVNQTDGGDGVFGLSLETIIRISNLLRGRKLSPETREKIKQANLERHARNGGQSKETRNKISKNHLGIIPNKETRIKMSLSATARIERDGNPFKGRKHTKESIEKIRVAKLGKPSPKKGKPSGKAGLPLSNTHKASIQRSWDIRRGLIKGELICQSSPHR